MQFRRGLLISFAATVAFAQDFSQVDKARIDMAVDEAKRAQEKLLGQKELLADVSPEIVLAKQLTLDKMKLAEDQWRLQKEWAVSMPDVAFAVNQAMDKAAFAMQKPFFQGGLKGAGGPLTEDEELKAMAIDGLMQNDPERAIPIVDKLLQNQQASIRLRMRALQSLANSNSPKAREIIARVAKEGSNAELQSRALQLLSSRDGSQNKQLLKEIYASATNVDIKRQILRNWAGMGAKDEVLNVAKSDSNPELRSAAINQLGGMRASADLAALYSAETSTEVRERVIRALGGAGDWQKLIDIAKTEKNEELRNRAIQQAGSMRGIGNSDALVEMYSSSTDASTRNAILRALSHQGNAKQMIALARKETNPELKRAALQHLSRMRGDEVTTYLMELLDK